MNNTNSTPSKWRLPSVRRLLRVAGVLVLVVAGMLYFVEPLQDAIFRQGASRLLDRGQNALMRDDALRAVVCGSGTPQPAPKSAKACIAVIAGGKLYVVDTGTRSSGNLVFWHLPVEQVAGVFLTHFHSDHIGDLGELNMQSWTFGRSTPLHVYGPPGVEQVVAGFAQAYQLDQGYRSATHGVTLMKLANAHMVPHQVTMPGENRGAMDRSTVVLEADGLKITAIEVNHMPVQPAYAYRFDYRGRSLVISGDTAYHLPLAAASRGVDVLFHEAQAQHMIGAMQQVATQSGQIRLSMMLSDIQRYHTSTLEAADIANQAHARLLAIYHADPPVLNLLLERIFIRGLGSARQDPWTLVEDGTLIELPINSSAIHVGHI